MKLTKTLKNERNIFSNPIVNKMDGGYYGVPTKKPLIKPKTFLPENVIMPSNSSQRRDSENNKELYEICQLNSGPKIRGLKKNMKKIMKLPMLRKMKDLGKKMSRKMIWLMFCGVDALNLHVSNPSFHNSFFDVAMMSIEDKTQEEIENDMMDIRKEITGFFNMHLMRVSNNANSLMVKDLNEKCGNLKGESRFVCDSKIDSGRCSIDLVYVVEEKQYNSPFVVMRYINKNNYKTMNDPLNYQGIRIMPLSQIYEEVFNITDDLSQKIRRGAGKLSDGKRKYLKSEFESWKLRKDQIVKILYQKELTLSCITLENLTRRCYPLLEIDNSKFNDRMTFLEMEQQVKRINGEFHTEVLKDYEKADTVEKGSRQEVKLSNLLKRANNIGFLPEDHDLFDSLNNDFNSDLLYEIRQTIIGY